MEEALLGFFQQARDRNLPLTRETKAKEFAEISIHKSKPSVFFKVLVSSTQAMGGSRNLSDTMIFHVY
jgi:hypothetical protein